MRGGIRVIRDIRDIRGIRGIRAIGGIGVSVGGFVNGLALRTLLLLQI